MATITRKARQHAHARRRATERFGITLTKSVRQEIVRMIQSGKARVIRRQTNRTTRFECEIQGHLVHVVYDKNRKSIVTFLMPPVRKENGNNAS